MDTRVVWATDKRVWSVMALICYGIEKIIKWVSVVFAYRFNHCKHVDIIFQSPTHPPVRVFGRLVVVLARLSYGLNPWPMRGYSEDTQTHTGPRCEPGVCAYNV